MEKRSGKGQLQGHASAAHAVQAPGRQLSAPSQVSLKPGDLTIREVWEVPGEDASVPVLLQGSQLDAHYLLLLGWQLLQHILLQPPQKVWRQQLVQLAYLQVSHPMHRWLSCMKVTDGIMTELCCVRDLVPQCLHAFQCGCLPCWAIIMGWQD